MLSKRLGWFVVCAALSAPTAQGSPIWMRRSESSIRVDPVECIARAFRALRAEGFTPDQNLSNGVWGSKEGRWTLVLCNPGPSGQMTVNIVSSALESEAAVHYPDHERVGARMGEPSVSPVASRSGCGWKDGQDPAAGSDPGRGLTAWQPHFQHVNGGSGAASAHDLVGARLATLSQCLPRDSYARIYASVSVLIAAAGRKGAGWIDGMDARGGADPGRGVSDKTVHAQHISAGPGLTTAHGAVAQRLAVLGARLSREDYARLYADVSIVIAHCGVSGNCG